jgi:hypothetical protein
MSRAAHHDPVRDELRDRLNRVVLAGLRHLTIRTHVRLIIPRVITLRHFAITIWHDNLDTPDALLQACNGSAYCALVRAYMRKQTPPPEMRRRRGRCWELGGPLLLEGASSPPEDYVQCSTDYALHNGRDNNPKKP